MAEQAMRIALLARAGNARDQLHRALSDLGANLVAEGDPGELDPAHVISLQPTLVLISIEPAIEAAIDRFDDLLAMPGVDVMYDDAEVTRQLDGWDLNRWARHLAAKLVGADVLPPAPEGSSAILNVPSAQVAATLVEPVASSMEQASAAPATRLELAKEPDIEMAVESSPVEDGIAADLPMPSLGLDLDMTDVQHAIDLMDAGSGGTHESPDDAIGFTATKHDDFTIDADLGNLDQMVEFETSGQSKRTSDAPAEPLLADIDFDSQPGGFSRFGGGDETPAGSLDDDVAALAAQLDAFNRNDQLLQPEDPDFSRAAPDSSFDKPASVAGRGAARADAVVPRQDFDFSSLSLTSMDETPVSAPAPSKPVEPTVTTRLNLTLETIPDELGSATAVAGAVLILAGLGGPDAVRQLLKALPARLPVPVLLYQHLEVGNHDRLVSQLAKVSVWPVYLASPGMRAQLGQVAVLPHGVGAKLEGTTMVFVPMANQRAMVDNLPAGESLVFMLSGADPDAVPAVLDMTAKGGVAMAQDPSTCFDPSAAQALASGGAKAGDAAALSRCLSTRWA